MMNISIQTHEKIKKLFPRRLRLKDNCIHFQSLKNIFYDVSDEYSNSVLFLQKRRLIDTDCKITSIGVAFVLAHEFNIRFTSMCLLTKIYQYQSRVLPDMVLPRPTLVNYFEYFLNENTILRLLGGLRTQGILVYLGPQQIRINSDIFEKLSKFENQITRINKFLDELVAEVDNLISQDPLILNNNVNSKLQNIVNC